MRTPGCCGASRRSGRLAVPSLNSLSCSSAGCYDGQLPATLLPQALCPPAFLYACSACLLCPAPPACRYLLVYPHGCDVANHLSLFLCVADYDKLLPGWGHFAQVGAAPSAAVACACLVHVHVGAAQKPALLVPCVQLHVGAAQSAAGCLSCKCRRSACECCVLLAGSGAACAVLVLRAPACTPRRRCRHAAAQTAAGCWWAEGQTAAVPRL